jgi:hypothetical protein
VKSRKEGYSKQYISRGCPSRKRFQAALKVQQFQDLITRKGGYQGIPKVEAHTK